MEDQVSFNQEGPISAEPVLNMEIIVCADINPEMIIDAIWSSDWLGNYARPDVTKLLINEEKYLLGFTLCYFILICYPS